MKGNIHLTNINYLPIYKNNLEKYQDEDSYVNILISKDNFLNYEILGSNIRIFSNVLAGYFDGGIVEIDILDNLSLKINVYKNNFLIKSSEIIKIIPDISDDETIKISNYKPIFISCDNCDIITADKTDILSNLNEIEKKVYIFDNYDRIFYKSNEFGVPLFAQKITNNEFKIILEKNNIFTVWNYEIKKSTQNIYSAFYKSISEDSSLESAKIAFEDVESLYGYKMNIKNGQISFKDENNNLIIIESKVENEDIENLLIQDYWTIEFNTEVLVPESLITLKRDNLEIKFINKENIVFKIYSDKYNFFYFSLINKFDIANFSFDNEIIQYDPKLFSCKEDLNDSDFFNKNVKLINTGKVLKLSEIIVDDSTLENTNLLFDNIDRLIFRNYDELDKIRTHHYYTSTLCTIRNREHQFNKIYNINTLLVKDEAVLKIKLDDAIFRYGNPFNTKKTIPIEDGNIHILKSKYDGCYFKNVKDTVLKSILFKSQYDFLVYKDNLHKFNNKDILIYQTTLVLQIKFGEIADEDIEIFESESIFNTETEFVIRNSKKYPGFRFKNYHKSYHKLPIKLYNFHKPSINITLKQINLSGGLDNLLIYNPNNNQYEKYLYLDLNKNTIFKISEGIYKNYIFYNRIWDLDSKIRINNGLYKYDFFYNIFLSDDLFPNCFNYKNENITKNIIYDSQILKKLISYGEKKIEFKVNGIESILENKDIIFKKKITLRKDILNEVNIYNYPLNYLDITRNIYIKIINNNKWNTLNKIFNSTKDLNLKNHNYNKSPFLKLINKDLNKTKIERISKNFPKFFYKLNESDEFKDPENSDVFLNEDSEIKIIGGEFNNFIFKNYYYSFNYSKNSDSYYPKNINFYGVENNNIYFIVEFKEKYSGSIIFWKTRLTASLNDNYYCLIYEKTIYDYINKNLNYNIYLDEFGFYYFNLDYYYFVESFKNKNIYLDQNSGLNYYDNILLPNHNIFNNLPIFLNNSDLDNLHDKLNYKVKIYNSEFNKIINIGNILDNEGILINNLNDWTINGNITIIGGLYNGYQFKNKKVDNNYEIILDNKFNFNNESRFYNKIIVEDSLGLKQKFNNEVHISDINFFRINLEYQKNIVNNNKNINKKIYISQKSLSSQVYMLWSEQILVNSEMNILYACNYEDSKFESIYDLERALINFNYDQIEIFKEGYNNKILLIKDLFTDNTVSLNNLDENWNKNTIIKIINGKYDGYSFYNKENNFLIKFSNYENTTNYYWITKTYGTNETSYTTLWKRNIDQPLLDENTEYYNILYDHRFYTSFSDKLCYFIPENRKYIDFIYTNDQKKKLFLNIDGIFTGYVKIYNKFKKEINTMYFDNIKFIDLNIEFMILEGFNFINFEINENTFNKNTWFELPEIGLIQNNYIDFEPLKINYNNNSILFKGNIIKKINISFDDYLKRYKVYILDNNQSNWVNDEDIKYESNNFYSIKKSDVLIFDLPNDEITLQLNENFNYELDTEIYYERLPLFKNENDLKENHNIFLNKYIKLNENDNIISINDLFESCDELEVQDNNYDINTIIFIKGGFYDSKSFKNINIVNVKKIGVNYIEYKLIKNNCVKFLTFKVNIVNNNSTNNLGIEDIDSSKEISLDDININAKIYIFYKKIFSITNTNYRPIFISPIKDKTGFYVKFLNEENKGYSYWNSIIYESLNQKEKVYYITFKESYEFYSDNKSSYFIEIDKNGSYYFQLKNQIPIINSLIIKNQYDKNIKLISNNRNILTYNIKNNLGFYNEFNIKNKKHIESKIYISTNYLYKNYIFLYAQKLSDYILIIAQSEITFESKIFVTEVIFNNLYETKHHSLIRFYNLKLPKIEILFNENLNRYYFELDNFIKPLIYGIQDGGLENIKSYDYFDTNLSNNIKILEIKKKSPIIYKLYYEIIDNMEKKNLYNNLVNITKNSKQTNSSNTYENIDELLIRIRQSEKIDNEILDEDLLFQIKNNLIEEDISQIIENDLFFKTIDNVTVDEKELIEEDLYFNLKEDEDLKEMELISSDMYFNIVSEPEGIKYKLKKGWNLIGIPFEYDTNTLISLSGNNIHKIYGFNKKYYKVYDSSETENLEKISFGGYWVYCLKSNEFYL